MHGCLHLQASGHFQDHTALAPGISLSSLTNDLAPATQAQGLDELAADPVHKEGNV